jgi:hypothetical protein
MDLFARTFLPAAADAGLDMPTISRHIPVFRRCLGADAVQLVTRCTRPDRSLGGDYLLTLTRHRLVVTHESRVVHRLRLHLDAPIHELADVSWVPDPTRTAMELSATAIDGIRERFTIRLRHREASWQLESTFARIFGRHPAPVRSLASAA